MKSNEIKKTLAQQLGLLPKETKENRPLSKIINNSLLGKDNLTREQYRQIGDNIWQEINKEKPSIKMVTPRKTIVSRLAAVASILLVAGVLLLQQQTYSPKINLTSVKGKVSFSNKNKALKQGFSLTAKSKAEVKINLAASGKLQFRGPGSLKLIQAAEKNGQPTQKWHLLAGKTAIKLEKGSYANFSLTTPHALIRVTGTAFTVEVTKTKTTLSVQEGQVDFKPINAPVEKIIAGENREAKITDKKELAPKQESLIKAKKRPKPKTRLTETIKLKNGTTLTGRVISQTANEVTIITKGGILKIPTTAIKSINLIKKVK